MQKITKKEFKNLHSAGKISLLQGMVHKDKNEILEILERIPDIESYTFSFSNHGNLTSDKAGYQSVNIYKTGRFIFIENQIDYSKDNFCSRNDKETFNTVYLMEASKMKVKSIGKNQTLICTDNMDIFISYETPVACFIAGQGYFKTSKKHSVTTSKHINQWLDGVQAQTRDQNFFNKLIG